MKCPNCGKDVTDGQSYCNACGSVLYGPRNVNLKNPGKVAGSDQSNDISSITGIDINSLSFDTGADDYYSKPEPEKKSKKKKNKSKKSSSSNISMYIFIAVIIVLSIICVVLFINNSKLKKEQPKSTTTKCEKTECKCPDKAVIECVKGFYGLAGYYSFQTPNTWRYSEVTGGSALTNDTNSILLLDYITGDLSKMSKDKMTTEYYNEGLATAKLEDGKIGEKNAIFVTYYASNIYFTDFYIDYDGTKVIYGQVSSPAENAIQDPEVQSILSSIIVLENRNGIKIMRAPVDYAKVFDSAVTEQTS